MPVIVWMAMIFIASSDSESGPRGSRILGPLIRWLYPDIAPEVLEGIILAARKIVHFVTFGLLAALFWRALSGGTRGPWRARTAWLSLGLTFAYAVSDEWHQSFVPTRVGSWVDVLIDTAGAAFTLGGWGAVRCWWRRR